MKYFKDREYYILYIIYYILYIIMFLYYNVFIFYEKYRHIL